MIIVHSSISCASAWLGNDPCETLRLRLKDRGEGRGILSNNEGASPNPERGKLDSAPLCYMLTANLPEVVKPVIVREAMNICTCQVSRGGWRERVPKEYSWHPGDPFRSPTLVVSERQGPWENHNLSSSWQRESDRLIVVMTQGNACRAKGSFRYRVFIIKRSSA